MKRAARVLIVAVLAAIAFTSQAAHADRMSVAVKVINIVPESPNDCLTIVLGTMNRLAFANLQRTEWVSGTRAGGRVMATCERAPGDNSFYVFIAGHGDGDSASTAVDVLFSNL